MKTKSLFVLLLLAYYYCINDAATVPHDLTLVPYAVGTEVVDACIQKIVQHDIFPYDQQLLRRIWFTESSINIDNGGLWQITPSHFRRTKERIDPMIHIEIMEIYDIDWNSIQWEDLVIPFYSALAARIFIRTVDGDLILSSDLNIQAEFWASTYTIGEDLKEFFIESVNFMSDTRAIRNFGLDIIYIVGLSDENMFPIVTQMLVNLTEKFQIGESSTRIGFISEGFDDPFFVFSLNEYSNLSSIVTVLNEVILTNSSNAWINNALEYSYSSHGFSEINGARDLIKGIPRAIVVITDLIINVNVAKDDNIITYILGLGGDTSSETQMIETSRQVVSRLSINAQLNELMEFQETVYDDLQKATARVPIGAVSSELLPNQRQYFNYPFLENGVTITIDIRRNNSRIYVSNWIRNPNSAAYDLMFDGPIKIERFLNNSILNSRLGSNRLFITMENNDQYQIVAFTITTKSGNDLGVPPKVETFSIEAINQVLSIKCVVTGNPLPAIKFFKENEQLKPGNRIKISYKSSNTSKSIAILQMSSLRQDDEGTYSCAGSVEFFNGSIHQDTVKQEVVVLGVLGGSLEDIPIDLKANIEDINVVKVSWAMPKHVKHVIIGFRLFYKSSGINCTDELEQPDEWTILDTNQTFVILDDLQDACTYEFMVQSESTEGYSANSKNFSIIIDFSVQIKYIPDNGPISIAMLIASCTLLIFISVVMTILLSLYGRTMIIMLKSMRQKVSEDMEDLQELTDKALHIEDENGNT